MPAADESSSTQNPTSLGGNVENTISGGSSSSQTIPTQSSLGSSARGEGSPLGSSVPVVPGTESGSVRDYLDGIVNSCRKGELSKTGATKNVLEALGKLSALSDDT